jgi:hypothetical protein
MINNSMWINNLVLALSIGGIYRKDYLGWQVIAAWVPLGTSICESETDVIDLDITSGQC